jgi:hypothetical protein
MNHDEMDGSAPSNGEQRGNGGCCAQWNDAVDSSIGGGGSRGDSAVFGAADVVG